MPGQVQGRTPLHLTGHSLAQHVLLQKGADPRLEDNRGNLPVVPEAEGIATEGQGGDDSAADEILGLSAVEIRQLGVSYAEGKNGKEVDVARAIVLYEEAAERGDATAARWMGWRYRQGRGVPRDKAVWPKDSARLRITSASLADGTPINPEARYTLAINSYLCATTADMPADAGVSLKTDGAACMIKFLEAMPEIDYADVSRVETDKE